MIITEEVKEFIFNVLQGSYEIGQTDSLIGRKEMRQEIKEVFTVLIFDKIAKEFENDK